MDLSSTAPVEDLARTRGLRDRFGDDVMSLHSAVSWSAIFAGAAAAAFVASLAATFGGRLRDA